LENIIEDFTSKKTFGKKANSGNIFGKITGKTLENIQESAYPIIGKYFSKVLTLNNSE